MKRCMVFFAVGVLALAKPGYATIINVPGDQPTIQAGIDASIDGDTVLVQQGTYVENINFNGHNIVLGSLFLMTGDTAYIAETIIDEDSSGTVVTFENGEDSTTAITGFTIQNGLAQLGGGIACEDSNPTINYNTISGNSATQFGGGGIACYNNSNATISNNTISGNSSAIFGGGISCFYNSNLSISNNTINENSFDGIYCYGSSPTISNNTISGNYGYGIYCEEYSPTISNNTISGNYGSGIFCRESSPAIANNTISGNFTGFFGGGIYCYSSSPTISNNTISGNSSAIFGGGIACHYLSNPVVVNTILWANIAEYSGNEIYLDDGSSISITYSDIEGGWQGQGNIDCDPMFCEPEIDNYFLAENSCCVGAGENGGDIGALGVGCEPTAVGEDQPLPFEYSLYQNYPNPFNASTTIRYSLPAAADVTVNIYNLLGRKVNTVVQGEQSAGHHQITWDASDHSSGIYFYRIQAGEYAETKKMVLLK